MPLAGCWCGSGRRSPLGPAARRAAAQQQHLQQRRRVTSPGLQLERLVGRHHTVRVPPPPAAKRLGAAAAGATSGSTGGTSSELPQDAVRLFGITDGSSVDAKLAELRAHPGAGCVSSLAAAAVALAGAHCTCTEPPCLAVADGLFHEHQPASAVLTAFLPACLPALLLQVWRWQNQTTSTTPPLCHSRQELESQVAAAAPFPSLSTRDRRWLPRLPQQSHRPCRTTPNTQTCGTCHKFRHHKHGTPPPAPARCADASSSGGGGLMACPWLQAAPPDCLCNFSCPKSNLFHAALPDCRSACA